MALERQTIEKKDFPVGRRGYDPEAVDAHLSMIADEMEAVTRTARQRTETLAAAASEQVRAIVEAAETTAAEIQDQAEREAREIRGDASREARKEREEAARDAQRERDEAAVAARTEREEAAAEAQSQREEASAQAREYVGNVSESTSQMLTRLDAMQSELGALTESLRTGASRLTAELELLESEMKDLSTSTTPGSALPPARTETLDAVPGQELALEPEPEQGPEAVELPPAVDEPGTEEVLEPEHDPSQAEEALIAELEHEPEPAGVGEADDTEGARLIALNMALNGTPREETDRYLAENFELADRSQLLDEVYASVEG